MRAFGEAEHLLLAVSSSKRRTSSTSCDVLCSSDVDAKFTRPEEGHSADLLLPTFSVLVILVLNYNLLLVHCSCEFAAPR